MKGQIKIMVFGTFDMVHTGHRNFFKQARALAPKPFLIASLARSENVLRIKGQKPQLSERQRLTMVKQVRGVNKAVLGDKDDYLKHIFKEKPDIIALGYDQTAYVKGLATALRKAGLKTKIIRLAAHKPHLYKTSLLRKP